MDKILLLRYDIGDYVPPALQRWEEFNLGGACNVFFYLTDECIFRYADEASYMCIDNIAIEQFYFIMFPGFDLDYYDLPTQDFIADCMMNSEFENATEEIIEAYGDKKQQRLSYTIEYESDIDYWSGIDEGFFFIRTKGLNDGI